MYQGRKVSLKVEERILPSGRKVLREIVQHKGAVAILPLINEETIIILRQYRPEVEEWLYEIPAGTLEPLENPCECAARELEEETGYKPGKLTELFEMYMAPGYSTEILHSFAAINLREGVFHPTESEELSVVSKTFDEAIEMIRTNMIRDAKTIATILYYIKFGEVTNLNHEEQNSRKPEIYGSCR